MDLTTILLIIIFAVIATIIILTIVAFFLKKPLSSYFQSFFQKITKEIFEDQRKILIEQYKSKEELIDERMKRGEQFIESKKDVIKDLVDKISKELDETKKNLTSTEKERIAQFNSLKAVMDEYKIITGGLKESTDNLKNLLSNNQMRGKYGEEVAENLLKSVGFVKGQNYIVNTSQDTTNTRPDFTMLLPDKTKINVDAKFPLQSLIKYQEAEDKQEKERYIKEFAKDVKEKIKQVTTRDYINPEENTVDFVILFIPNEMIFSFVYEKLNDVWNDAMKKKVIMAGPFSFTAILRMIFQSYKNFKYQENLYDIIKLIKIFEQEYEKFNDELNTLGTRIKSVSTQYDTVSITRTKKLSGVVEKIRGENLPDIQEAKVLEVPIDIDE